MELEYFPRTLIEQAFAQGWRLIPSHEYVRGDRIILMHRPEASSDTLDETIARVDLPVSIALKHSAPGLARETLLRYLCSISEPGEAVYFYPQSATDELGYKETSTIRYHIRQLELRGDIERVGRWPGRYAHRKIRVLRRVEDTAPVSNLRRGSASSQIARGRKTLAHV